ncbi:MAG TPA: hypothetical protein VKT28_02675 [Puia sp.]|nr:hypothetical protein [Puia sp.]
MRKAVGILFFLFIFCKSFAQYTVTKVIGSVKKISGEPLKTGSTLSDNDVLLFSTPNDMVRVIVAGKGIYVINPSSKAEKKQDATSTVMEVLKYTMHVKSKEGYLSGRGENVEMVPDAFETDGTVNSKNLIENTNKFIFNSRKYDVSNGSKFFLQISFEGAKPVIRPLKTMVDTLFLNADDFKINVDDVSKKAEYAIGFFSRQKGSSELLADINPYLDQANEMEAIINVVISQSKEQDKTILQQQCYSEVYGALGKPSDVDFKNSFDKAIAARKN